MHMRAPRFRLAQSGSEGSRISGGELIPAKTHQPVSCGSVSCGSDSYLQGPAHQTLPSSSVPGRGGHGKARTSGWPVRGHGPVWQVGLYPNPEEKAHCRRGQDRHTQQVSLG